MKLIKPYVKEIDEINYNKILEKIEKIGRVCYQSDRKEGDTAEQFVKRIIGRGHEAIIEHENISLSFITDRGVTHEIVRHRIASYAQESTRYCNYSKDKFGSELTFIIPPWTNIKEGIYNWTDYISYKVAEENIADNIWFTTMLNAENDYMVLLESGWVPQQARDILPNSLKTEIVITYNLREWRHFFNLRCSERAHPQMCEIALKALELLYNKTPIFFEDLYNKYFKKYLTN